MKTCFAFWDVQRGYVHKSSLVPLQTPCSDVAIAVDVDTRHPFERVDAFLKPASRRRTGFPDVAVAVDVLVP